MVIISGLGLVCLLLQLRSLCLGSCHLYDDAHSLTDSKLGYQMGYAIGKFKAYKYAENTACKFNQTNVKFPAYCISETINLPSHFGL